MTSTFHLVMIVQILGRLLTILIKFCNTAEGGGKGGEGSVSFSMAHLNFYSRRLQRCSSLWDLAQSYLQDTTW